ncbi:MAG: glycosyltransferase family 39 protein [Candidatus Daviesbacteria bacterium]|nr:glycosyltransferase family 39 protein [Candidatus Daviesbacteria bacterium]
MLRLFMIKFIKQILKKHYLFIIIFLIALILRLYRIDYLTTFGRDQGIDYLSIKDMIINHKLTLIGIKVSLADFFQGPVYLYLLAPLFYVMKLNPLAGAYTAVIISLFTILILYYVVFKMFNVRAANLATSFFAVSPQLVAFGNTPLYQNFTPLFILLGVWCLYQALLVNKESSHKRYFFIFLTGIFIGIGLELHFLIITLALAVLIYIMGTGSFIKSIIFYLFGLLISLSPTILFELKHDFLNIHLLINYFNNSKQISLPFLSVWGERLNYFAIHDYNYLIIAPVLLFILSLVKNNQFSVNSNFLKKLSLITFFIIFIFAISLSSFGTHYLLPLLMLLLIIISVYLSSLRPSKFINITCFIFLGLNLLITLSQLNNNHGYFMPDGWSLKKIDQVSRIIIESASIHPNYNVASLLDGDTRTYPLRFVLSLKGNAPQDYTSYPQNDYLYVVDRDDINKVINSNVWEINSMKPFNIEQAWQMDDGISLYLLARVKNI